MGRKGSSGLSTVGKTSGGNKLAAMYDAINKAVWKTDGKNIVELKVAGVGEAYIIRSQLYKAPNTKPITVYTGGARNSKGTSLLYLMGVPETKQVQYTSLAAAKNAVVNEMRRYVDWKYGKTTIL